MDTPKVTSEDNPTAASTGAIRAMSEAEKMAFVKERGWSTWYNEAYWVNPATVADPKQQDYTNYGMSLDDAIRWENIGRPPHKPALLGIPVLSRMALAVATKGLTKPPQAELQQTPTARVTNETDGRAYMRHLSTCRGTRTAGVCDCGFLQHLTRMKTAQSNLDAMRSDIAIVVEEIRKSADKWAAESMDSGVEHDCYEVGRCQEAWQWVDYISSIFLTGAANQQRSGAAAAGPTGSIAPSNEVIPS